MNSNTPVDAEDMYRATMNEMTMLIGCPTESPQRERLSALVKMGDELAASLPREQRRASPSLPAGGDSMSASDYVAR